MAMGALVALALPGLAPCVSGGAGIQGGPMPAGVWARLSGDMAALTSVLAQGWVPSVWLSDPLFLGLLLLAATAFLGTGRSTAARQRASLGGAVLVLCVTESLFVLAAPGVTGLDGVRYLLHEGANPGLSGTSACCGLALAFTGAFPRLNAFHKGDEGSGEEELGIIRQIFDERASLLSFLQIGWLLYLGDLLLPGLSGETPGMALLAFLGRLGGALGLLLVLEATRTERNARLAALMAGLAFLLALSGRFAA
ncbi:hypothetical protein [Oecophyllibacter saccharovorans]|uniref:hypothetical protein n=1 Tax=Oecophyllibacter saccharovorans TaxID=2558360 RepID=UPI0011435758|nr:hypothetical protein [Oecophyllibacter saccharovorans]QDH14747.1 hypothetical protein E3E11_01480 [Oecophyllibacter saccharovorans]